MTIFTWALCPIFCNATSHPLILELSHFSVVLSGGFLNNLSAKKCVIFKKKEQGKLQFTTHSLEAVRSLVQFPKQWAYGTRPYGVPQLSLVN